MESHYQNKKRSKKQYSAKPPYQTDTQEIDQLFEKTFSILKDLGADVPESVIYP